MAIKSFASSFAKSVSGLSRGNTPKCFPFLFRTCYWWSLEVCKSCGHRKSSARSWNLAVRWNFSIHKRPEKRFEFMWIKRSKLPYRSEGTFNFKVNSRFERLVEQPHVNVQPWIGVHRANVECLVDHRLWVFFTGYWKSDKGPSQFGYEEIADVGSLIARRICCALWYESCFVDVLVIK